MVSNSNNDISKSHFLILEVVSRNWIAQIQQFIFIFRFNHFVQGVNCFY